MRAYALALVACLAVPVSAQDPFLTGKALQDEAAKSCKEGCVVFTRQEVQALQDQFNQILTERMRQAYAAGQKDARQKCASLI